MNSDQENIALVVIKFKLDWLGYKKGRIDKRDFIRYFFLSIEGRDPSTAFLKQLGEHFVVGSLATVDKNAKNFKVSNIIHKQTRKPGIQIFVRDIKIIKPDQAVATCGHHAGGLNGEGSDFHLRKENTRWVILKRDNIWKS